MDHKDGANFPTITKKPQGDSVPGKGGRGFADREGLLGAKGTLHMRSMRGQRTLVWWGPQSDRGRCY